MMIGTQVDNCITEAFAPRTLAGLTTLSGFDSGCGCGSLPSLPHPLPLSLSGLGADPDPSDCYTKANGEQVCVSLTSYTEFANPCDDTSLWAVKKGDNGKCYNYCTADITQQQEVDSSFCAIGASTITGKVPSSPFSTTNLLLIGGIALGAFILSR